MKRSSLPLIAIALIASIVHIKNKVDRVIVNRKKVQDSINRKS